MTYNIKNYSGVQVASIPDGGLDQTSTSLYLPAKNHVDYGEAINDDLVFLLENFASPTPPTGTNILTGQLWYNSTAKNLNVYTGVQWVLVNSITNGNVNGNPNIYGPNGSPNPISGNNEGELFWDTSCFQLWCWSLTTSPASWILVNPIAPDQLHSNMFYYSVSGQDILAMIVDNNVVAVWSLNTFTPGSSATSYLPDGSTITWSVLFPQIHAGLTFSSNINAITSGDIFPTVTDTYDVGKPTLQYQDAGFNALNGDAITTGMIPGTGVDVGTNNTLNVDIPWLTSFVASNLLPENPFSAIGVDGITVTNGNNVSIDPTWFNTFLATNQSLIGVGSNAKNPDISIVSSVVNSTASSTPLISTYDVSQNNGVNTHQNTIIKAQKKSYLIAYYSLEAIPQDCRGIASWTISSAPSGATVGSLIGTAYIGPNINQNGFDYVSPREMYLILLLDNTNPPGSYVTQTWTAVSNDDGFTAPYVTMGNSKVYWLEINGGLTYFGETVITTPTTTPIPTTLNPLAPNPIFIVSNVQELVNGNWVVVPTVAAGASNYSIGTVWQTTTSGSTLNVQSNTINVTTSSSPSGLFASNSPTSSSFLNGTWEFEYAVSPTAPSGSYTVTQVAISNVSGKQTTNTQTFQITVGAAVTTTPTPSIALNINISSNVQNIVLSNLISSNLTSQGVNWTGSVPLNVTITVGSGVVIGSGDPTVPSFICDYSTAQIPAAITSGTITVSMVNNGYIVGAGGAGGSRFGIPSGYTGPYQSGQTGGAAILAQVPITITNSGTIAGGGGGGAAQCVDNGYRYGGAGGGGAGSNAGAGGVNQKPYNYGNGWGGGEPGSAGTLTAGGLGGPAPTDNGSGCGPGGNGGSLGQPGQGTTGMAQYGGNQSGGAAGSAVVGGSFITWQAQGTILGPKS